MGRWIDTSKLSSQQERLYIISIFLIRLIILAVPLYLVLSLGNLYLLQVAVAGQASSILSLMGYGVVQEGFSVLVTTGEPFSFFISADSTGWKSILFFSALVIAVPGMWKVENRKRAVGLAIGIPIIWAGNLLRIVGIVAVQQAYGFSAGMLFHDYVYRIGLVALVLAVWFFWLRANLTGN